MITVRPSGERGGADHGWLETRHTFSFARYHDPRHMGFGTLRVLNEDRVEPGRGFGSHPHDNMEIVSYVLDGALEHRDSTGTGSVVRRGDVQRMTAGTGIVHSEFNASREEALHFFQVWVLPERRGLTPGYEQATFDDESKRDRLRLIVSPDGRDGSLSIHQDVSIFASLLGAGRSVRHELPPGRRAWMQVASGALALNGGPLGAGDGAAVEGETALEIDSVADAEFLLFDLA